MDQSENHRVLIVDDNESIHADFHKIIGVNEGLDSAVESAAAALFDEPTQATPPPASYELDSAFQGQQGVSLVQQSVESGRPYALAFVDVRMPPGLDGIQTVEKMWQVDSNLQVVICTAYSDYSWRDMNAALGDTGRWLILKKPFDTVEVKQLASSLVAKWNLAKAASRTLHELEQMVSQQTQAIHRAHEESIHRLVTASLCRDEETGSHIRRTGLYCELVAAAAGWSDERVEQVRLAAPMHDIGKIGIPDAILRKSGRLTPEETVIMRTHASLGANILSGSTSPVLRLAQEIAMYHHEHWDGTGYPTGLAGEAIPEAARIVAIVDFYDAMTHNRVYRRRLPEAEVLKMMLDSRGTHFDPRLLDIFMSLLPEMRVISQTMSEDGEIDDPTNFGPSPEDLSVSAASNGGV